MSAVLTDRIAKEHAAAGDVLSPAVVGDEQRRRAVEALTASGLPTTRDENWKYANLRTLERVRWVPAAPRARADIAVGDLPPVIEGYARYTFVDGAFVAELSRPTDVAGIGVRSLRSERVGVAAADAHAPDSRLGCASGAHNNTAHNNTLNVGTSAATAASSQGAAPNTAATNSGSVGPLGDHRFALLNDAFATDAAVINVSEGTSCPACIELIFVATEPAQTAASYPRFELNVGANATIGLIERHISLHENANFTNGAVRVNIASRARVNHYRVQQAGARSTWIDTLTANVDQDARYELHAVNLGALAARSTLHIQLAGERAELALHVVSLGDEQQVHDGFALVEHIAANTKSEQNIRGIAGGRSRVAFNSKVVVREQARGTDSRQSLRGLLAGAQAEIDVRPQLEIYTDDVRCSHGATAGKLDDNMLFYLLSRGIERDTAQQLLKWAFLEDVVSRITIPDLRKHIEASLAGQMRETAALKDLI
jgi:Fe-S cluster assembly protein SufD